MNDLVGRLNPVLKQFAKDRKLTAAQAAEMLLRTEIVHHSDKAGRAATIEFLRGMADVLERGDDIAMTQRPN